MTEVPEQLPLVPCQHAAFTLDPFDLVLQDRVTVLRGFELQTKVALDRLSSMCVGFCFAAEPPEIAFTRFGALASMLQLIAKVRSLGRRALSSFGLARSLRPGQHKFLRQRVDFRREQREFLGEISLHASALSTSGLDALPSRSCRRCT